MSFPGSSNKSKFRCTPNPGFEKLRSRISNVDQIFICIKVLIKYRSVLSLEVALKVWDISAPDSILFIKFSKVQLDFPVRILTFL